MEVHLFLCCLKHMERSSKVWFIVLNSTWQSKRGKMCMKDVFLPVVSNISAGSQRPGWARIADHLISWNIGVSELRGKGSLRRCSRCRDTSFVFTMRGPRCQTPQTLPRSASHAHLTHFFTLLSSYYQPFPPKSLEISCSFIDLDLSFDTIFFLSIK